MYEIGLIPKTSGTGLARLGLAWFGLAQLSLALLGLA